MPGSNEGEIVVGSFRAGGWPEIYDEIRRRCGGDWDLLDTQCVLAIWDSLRRRRLTYNVVFTAHIAQRDHVGE